MGLLSIGAVLEHAGHTITILDFSAEPFDPQKLIRVLSNVDVVGITVLSVSLPKAVHLIELIKINKSEIPIIVGGPHCTLFPEKALDETGADICVQGDGEHAILEICQVLEGKKI